MRDCRLFILFSVSLAMAMSSASCDSRKAGELPLSIARADEAVQNRSGPMWVLDPADPGPDVPRVGRSLFDFLVSEQQEGRMVYKVPFPFTALIQKIEQELESGERGSPLKRVLIPLNRSLQRHAAKPEYFAHPRAVVGVDGEPLPRAGSSGMLLKDRLFLGYQEKAEILEVISYNEAAGRFEFQVVRDYGPGKTPRVVYANRALCTACHQNQSPIFSRPLWDETNANPAIAGLLEEQHADFYRFPLHQGIDVPDAIDQATDRANEFSAYQLLWQEGCERARSPSGSIHCRADIFRFLMQSRLTGLPDVFHRLPGYGDQFVPRFAAQWNEKWPQGLKIPNPDLPNRNPLDYEPAMAWISPRQGIPPDTYGVGERSRIRSILEPTILREPIAVWSMSPEVHEAVDRLIVGLSGFLADVDIERLDRYLFRQSAGPEIQRRRYQSGCEVDVRQRGRSADRVTFRCTASEQPSGKPDDGFSMEGVLYLQAGIVAGGTIERLSTGRGNEVGLNVMAGRLTSKDGRYSGRIVVTQKERRLHARLAEGGAIMELTLQFSAARKDRLKRQTASLSGSATMTVIEDYALVQRAIDAMVRGTLLGESDVFARKPFRRASLMKALFRQLQVPPLIWCCEATDNLPTAILMTDETLHEHELPVDNQTRSPALKAFHRYCAQCHHEDLAFPPNFLHGSPRQIQEQVSACAERIFFRLEMWGLAPSARHEAPMPPAAALQRLHLSPEQWAGHADLALLKSHVADLAASQNGKPVRLEDLSAKGYDNLRACVPPPGSAMAARSQPVQ